MPEKSPETYSLLTYLWMFGISCLGGVVAFVRKVKTGHVRAWNFTEFVGELFTSAFAGIITFWLCQASNFGMLQTAGLVGIAGHMGSRAIFMLERYFASKFPGAASALDEESNQLKENDDEPHP